MNSIEKNTVSAENQINVKFRTQFIGSDTPDKKVLILGNSITYHGEKADIGWHGNWGMAASNPENDYVHLLYKKSKELCPKVQFCVVQISSLEADFCNIELMKEYEIIKNYAPDIVVLRFGENIKSGKYDLTKLNQSYDYFVKNYLVSSKAYLIFTTCFWENGFVDEMIRKYCGIFGGELIELGDLGEDDSMKAIGKFEHSGVQNHPGDLGMKNIADRIYGVMKKILGYCERRRQMYSVKVNGNVAKLKPVRVSAIPFNRTWPGHQRDVSQSEVAYVLHLEDNGPVEISVASDSHIDDVKIRPQSKNICVDKNENCVNFCLREHGQYALEINGTHHAIHIFYDKPEEYEDICATYSFESGEHRLGKLELDDNDSVYIGKDAVLYANLFAVGRKNIKIFGHGTLNGSLETRTEKNGDVGWDGEKSFSKEKLHTIGCLRLIDCKDIMIDGITITDSSSYAASIYASKNICINNVKVVGHWKYNNDGIDLLNCSDAVIKNSFIRSFDDSICIKGISAFSERNCENITIDNCVLWCGWGKTLEIGLATAARKIENITFSNCDLIHNQNTCISIANGQFANISHIKYENINVEYEYVDTPVLQKSDEQEYSSDEKYLPRLINIADWRRNWQGNVSADDEGRSIKNVNFENIRIICNDNITPDMGICRANKYGEFENIMINSIFVHDKTINNIDFLSDEEFDNIIIERKFNQ